MTTVSPSRALFFTPRGSAAKSLAPMRSSDMEMPTVRYIHYVHNYRLPAAQGGGAGRCGRGARGLERHPDKTFIGRISKGFDFLGYHFGPDGLTVAKAIERAPGFT
jgi:hypothetical protein